MMTSSDSNVRQVGGVGSGGLSRRETGEGSAADMFRFGFRRRRATKTYRVTALDGSTFTFELEGRATGAELLGRSLDAVRATGDPEYFGLASYEENFVKWIIPNKSLKKQFSGQPPFQLHLRLQVYPADHHSLTQPSTRHLLFLQIRRDIMENRFTCTDDKLVWLVGLVVQADLGDYAPTTYAASYLSQVDLIPRLTNQLEERIQQQHKMNSGKPSIACQEEFLALAQMESAYGIISYQVQDSSRNPVTVTVAPAGVCVVRGVMGYSQHLWHSILKISHKGRRLFLDISSSAPSPVNLQFTCLTPQMASNMAHYLSCLQTHYCTSVLQKPSRLQRFFTSRRSVRVLKPLAMVESRSSTGLASNPLQRRSLGSEVVPMATAPNHVRLPHQLPHPRHSRSLSSPSDPATTQAEIEGGRGASHAHTSSWSAHHSQPEAPQPSPLPAASTTPPVDPPARHPQPPHSATPPVEPPARRRHSSSRPSQPLLSPQPPLGPQPPLDPQPQNTPHSHSHNHQSTPVSAHHPEASGRRHSYKEEWRLPLSPVRPQQTPPHQYPHHQYPHHRHQHQHSVSGSQQPQRQTHPYQSIEHSRRPWGPPETLKSLGPLETLGPPGALETLDHRQHNEPLSHRLPGEPYRPKSTSDTAVRWPHRDNESFFPDFIPEEGGGYLVQCQERHSSPKPSSLPTSELAQSKSSTFPREGDPSSPPQPGTEAMGSVVDFLDEALGVLDEEETQRKERELQRAQKPWKPQHRGRFRLSLQDSSYYDHRLFNSYRHFNRTRAFHGSKHSSSTIHINTSNDTSVEKVANVQLQESLVELSQTSDTAIDPHIRSFVFEGSQTECGGATEL